MAPGPPALPPTLRELRHQRGLTMDAVGVLAGVDIAAISRIERGLSQPRPETIVKLARALGMSARTLRDIIANPTRDGQGDDAA